MKVSSISVSLLDKIVLSITDESVFQLRIEDEGIDLDVSFISVQLEWQKSVVDHLLSVLG